MIILQKREQVEIYQVKLALREKTKQNPFIAVLILAREQSEITAELLKEYLLPTLPIRACNNLLIRLTQQGYLEKKHRQTFSGNNWLEQSYLEAHSNDDDYDNLPFVLTGLGDQSAIDKSFWVGEKGIYNVYVSHSNLLNQQIIKIEKIQRGEDDRNEIKAIRTPSFITDSSNQILNINKKEIRIEEIDTKCFQLNSQDCSLEIQSSNDETLLKIVKEKQTFFQYSFETNEANLREELLENTNEFEYDENKKVVLSEFNQDNLSFNRKIKLKNPLFRNNQFYSIVIENVVCIPSDKQNAQLWLIEILFNGIDKYFLDDDSFNEFAENKAKRILAHYNLELPTRKQLKQTISVKDNAFYQTAKLESIDYLNY